MPFIVTTKRPQSQIAPQLTWHTSSRAVATLEEATAAAERAIRKWRDDAGTREAWDRALDLLWVAANVRADESTSIPLPDGTVIEVEPTTYHALWHAVPWDSGFRGGPYMETDGAQNITGYNAWQETA